MNKKVLTLCAAMLLTGSLATLEAASISITALDAKPGVEVSSNVIKITKDVDLKGDYLLINEPHMIIEGDGLSEDAATFYGRIVITAKDVTVKNLKINLKNDVSNFSVYKNAITVLAPDAKILDNEIMCEGSGKFMASGISIFPTATDAKFTINGNTIIGANSKVGQWQSAGILLSEDIVFSLGDGLNTSAVKLTDFDITSISNNTYENCAADYVYTTYNGTGTTFKAYQTICVTPVKDPETGDYINLAYIKSLVEDSNKETVAIFNGTAEEFQKIVEDENIQTTSANVAVQCTGDENGEGAANVLFGTATNPDNGNGAIISGVPSLSENVFGYELLEQPNFNSNEYYLLILKGHDGASYIVVENKDGDFEAVKVASQSVIDTYSADSKALWKASEMRDPRTKEWLYSFTNKAGNKLKAGSNAGTGNDGMFEPVGNAQYNNGFVFKVNDTDLDEDDPTYFGLYKTADNYFTGDDLIERYGDYFTLGITYKNDKNKDVDVTGVFAGQLRPVTEVTYSNGQAEYTDATTQKEFMLVNEKGNIIVIDTKAPLFEAPTAHGYAFTTITPKQWTEWQNTASLKTKYNYVTEFKLAYDYNNQSTTEAVTNIEIGGYTVGLEKKEGNIILVADVEKQLLDDPTISIKLNAGNGIAAKDWLTSPSYYIVEAINKDKKAPHYGKVLGLDEWGSVDWVAPENVDLTKPEGQFAIDQTYKFTNRESGAYRWILANNQLYKVAGEDNVYALVTPNGNDTLRITPITADKYTSADGFKRFSASELNANTYTVAMKSLMGDPFIIENHNDKHRLGLSADESTEWRIEMPTVKLMDATDDLIRLVPDTVTIETPIEYYVAGKGWQTTTATDYEDDYYAPNTALKICTYILKNIDNGEYLDGQDWSESAGNAYYVCRPKTDKKVQIATRIALKEDGDGTVNLVPVRTENSWYYAWKEGNVSYSAYEDDWTDKFGFKEDDYKAYAKNLKLSDYKILGGTSTLTGVLKDEALYKATTNDLFVIEKAEAPTYKKLAQDDKIILTLKENLKDEYVLFEDGDFAGMGNRLAHKDINPTLYVDTAYVNRVGNYAYQYLLSVRPTRIDTTYQCNLPEEHGVHRADTTKGFFLVNMVDSAKANQNVHNNKFMYDGEYKLAFVEGYHTNDSLFFTEEGKVISKMEVGNGDFNIAKYAFKMVDETENEFVVETASGYAKKYNYVKDNNGHWHWTVASVESKPGYLRWVNDNLVVTEDIDKAAIFTMETSDKEATANESIAAGNVVVVGTNGAVIVKGAEGKNVIVSTILGKVVANEVVSSDNATIAAPAGIVVVSVDGESFKVVVK